MEVGSHEMIYDSQARPNGVSPLTGQVLAEAMPWIKNVTGKTIVIKYGGAAMVDEELRAAVMADIVLLKIIGVNPVLVHGGGKAISKAMEAANIPVEFKDGLRVTTSEAMSIVRSVLAGQVNQDLVSAMNRHGDMAVGMNGSDAGIIKGRQLSPELGRVGSITEINPGLIEDAVKDDYIPIIASVALDEDGGFLNVNADVAAGHIAAAIGAHKIIFLTDVNGLYLDFEDKDSFVSRLSASEAKKIIEAGTNSGGMIPKLESAVLALDAGVSRAHIINGTIPHALILETLTDKGIGTMVKATSTPEDFDAAPLGNFASKLVEMH